MRTILPHEHNPALREVAAPIPPEKIASPHIQSLISEMKALLAVEKHGVALAAPQVGESLQLFIVSGEALAQDAKPKEENIPTSTAPSEPPPTDQVYINPEIVKVSRLKRKKHEGCLSIRGQWGVVPRVEKMTLRAYNERGERITRGASGFLAHIFQHELDHLEGILYTDKAIEIYEDDHEHA